MNDCNPCAPTASPCPPIRLAVGMKFWTDAGGNTKWGNGISKPSYAGMATPQRGHLRSGRVQQNCHRSVPPPMVPLQLAGQPAPVRWPAQGNRPLHFIPATDRRLVCRRPRQCRNCRSYELSTSQHVRLKPVGSGASLPGFNHPLCFEGEIAVLDTLPAKFTGCELMIAVVADEAVLNTQA